MGTNEKNMTAGSPGKLIITFAIPLMLGNIFQQFYTASDLFMFFLIFQRCFNKSTEQWVWSVWTGF